MVQIAADAAHVRDGTSGLIPQRWLDVLPAEVRALGERHVFAGIAQFFDVMGVIGRVDELDEVKVAVGEIAVRLGVKPWEMSHFRYNYINSVPRTEILNLLALTRLGAVRNEADLIAWSLKRDGVDGELG